MRIVIAGGTGFIGQALAKHFLKLGYELVIIGRDIDKINNIYANRVIAKDWEDFNKDKSDLLLGSDLIVNLAGTNIAEKRWSKHRKKEIIESRVFPTQRLAQTCALYEKHSPPLFNASAVGIYGLHKTINGNLPKAFSEDEPLNFDKSSDFVSEIVKAWERATYPARDKGVRVVNMRFGLVLGKGGMLAKLKTPFLLGLGGPIGSGDQPFPWVALDDLISAVDFLLTKPDIRGPVNIVAPQCVKQKEFAEAFAHVLHRPSILKTPGLLIKGIFGEMGEELLLNGQCAYPKVLLSNNFEFKFPDINATLKHIFTNYE